MNFFPEYNFKAIGLRLRKLRSASKMTPTECAKHIGISRSNFYNIESGVSQNLEISTVKKICSLFNITETEFLWGKEDKGLPNNANVVSEAKPTLYLTDIDEKVVLSMRGLSEDEKRDILQGIEDKKLLKEIKKKKRA